MANVIVAFSKPEDGKNIKGILARNGYETAAVCTSGSQAIAAAEELAGGILISGYRFEDMLCGELRHYLPAAVDMLVISSPSRAAEGAGAGLIYLPMPLKVCDLLSTLEMMVQSQERMLKRLKRRPKERSKEEQGLIDRAKELLMARNGMTELEAHRYIQKCSMDSGNNLVETAQMVISLIHP